MKLTVCALFLVLVPVAYCVTTANVCRIAGTVLGAVLGSINGGMLEKGCADTSNACNKPSRISGINILHGGSGNILSQQSGAGQVVQREENLACSEMATGAQIAEAAKGKDPKQASSQISKLVCKPTNYVAMVTSCNEAVKAAKVANGSDLSTVKGCEKLQFIDNLGKACIPQAA